MRGRPKETPIEPKPDKYTRTFECDECTEVWKYDIKKSPSGPIDVVIIYKGGIDKQKNWNKRAKEAKDDRRTARQMKKIKNQK